MTDVYSAVQKGTMAWRLILVDLVGRSARRSTLLPMTIVGRAFVDDPALLVGIWPHCPILLPTSATPKMPAVSTRWIAPLPRAPCPCPVHSMLRLAGPAAISTEEEGRLGGSL